MFCVKWKERRIRAPLLEIQCEREEKRIAPDHLGGTCFECVCVIMQSIKQLHTVVAATNVARMKRGGSARDHGKLDQQLLLDS